MFLPDSVSSKIDFGPGCWLWMGAVQSRGYGSVSIDGRTYLAHRVVYGYLCGPIPEGLTLDHLCLVKRCVNPAHLEPVTAVENKRRETSSRTHCLRGHPLAGDNLRINRNGHRSCLACVRARRGDRGRASAGAPLVDVGVSEHASERPGLEVSRAIGARGGP